MKATTQSAPKKIRQYRHTFRFTVEGDDSDERRTFTHKARVIRATKKVELLLTAADVERSIKLKGAGNTQKCAMALCAKRQKAKFPHPVDGYIDWQYSSAYVVSKVGKSGLPEECYAYRHWDGVAQQFDTKEGQEALLRELKRTGDRVVKLYAWQPNKHKSSVRKANPVPRRKMSHSLGQGAKLRYAIASLGGV